MFKIIIFLLSFTVIACDGTSKKSELVKQFNFRVTMALTMKIREIKKIKTVYISSSKDLFETYTSKTQENQIIEAANCVNIAVGFLGKGKIIITKKQLLKLNPQIIITPFKKQLMKDLALRKLRAVKDSMIFEFPKDLDGDSNFDILKSVWLADKVYPKLYDEVNFGELKKELLDIING